MAAHVLRLRLALLVGAFRGDSRRTGRTVAGLVLLVATTAVGCWALLTLRDATTEAMVVVTVLSGSAVTLGFAVAPLIAGVTDPLDPRRFAVLDQEPIRLAGLLVLAGVISVPIFALTALYVCTVLVWVAHGVPWVIAFASAALAIVTCIVLARVCMALTALFLHERRSRELSGLVVVAALAVIVPVGVFLSSLEWSDAVPSQLTEAVRVLALTPFGAATALPGLVAAGSADAVLSLLVSLGTLAALGAVWIGLVHRILTTIERPTSGRERGGFGWFGVAPGTPGGAIAARSLIYGFRDRRYLANIAIIPVVALLSTVPLLIAGVPGEYVVLVPVPLAALFLGWLPHNDLAYDSTAVWMHIASGIRGVSDRVGRLIPILVLGIPVLAITIPFSISLHGRWAMLPAMVGVCSSLFLCGLGLSSIASAASPYPVTRHGDSPFEQPQRTGSGAAASQALVMLGALTLSAPALWWGWLAVTSDIEAASMALWGGVAAGLTVLVLGVAIGSAVFERRGGRLMEFAEST